MGYYLVSRHVYKFQARSGWKGMNGPLCFTWSWAACGVWRGLAETLRFLWAVLKIAVGTLLRGRGGGFLGAGWGCLAPSSSCQALCEEVLQVHRIQIWEGLGAPPPPPLSPPTQAGPRGPELKKDCSVVTKPGDKVPEGGLISFLLFQRATSGLMRLLLRPWVLRAWELLGPDVVCFPESRLPGEEPPWLACPVR